LCRVRGFVSCHRYEAVDPDQRLVAAELEARWNTALQKVRELEQKLEAFDRGLQHVPLPSKELLVSLAQDLPAVWNAPSTDMRLKQRIIRMLIEEIVADVDESRRDIVLLMHWAGGRHSELRLKKRELGQHRRCTSVEAVEVVRQMAGRFADELIAATLNRLGMRTGMDNTWDKDRVYSLRHYQKLPDFDPQLPRTRATLREAAQRLHVSEASVRRLIVEKRSRPRKSWPMHRGRFRWKRWIPTTSDKRSRRFSRERPARKNTPRKGNKQCFQLFSEVEQNVAAFGRIRKRVLAARSRR
jgi:hypothetical protein